MKIKNYKILELKNKQRTVYFWTTFPETTSFLFFTLQTLLFTKYLMFLPFNLSCNNTDPHITVLLIVHLKILYIIVMTDSVRRNPACKRATELIFIKCVPKGFD